MSQDEVIRAFQRENQEVKEFNKQAMIQLNQLTEIIQKMICQQVHLQHQPPPAIPSPLPTQPLPNPKGGLNAISDKPESEKEIEDTDNKEAEQQVYELLVEITGSKTEEDEDIGEILDFCEEFDSDYKEKEFGKEEHEDEWGKEVEAQNDKGEIFFINTVSDKREDEEELPIKCEDPGPCLVTCKIKGFDIPGCLCNPGASAGVIEDVMVKIGKLVIPMDFHVIKPAPGERGHPQVLLGRPFLKTSGFKLTYDDDIFTFSSGETTETFQITPTPKKKNHRLREDDRKMRGKESTQIGMIEALIRELLKKMKEEEGLGKKEKEKEPEERCRAEQRN
ncbi:hypothetical protein PIB30_066517 [Stylosanthes scabra]|uniref:Uncharacterized protein n=1 Tax=Stylosanthes scabra TaxID=79078 RepID=A0ABU6ZL55_9FABA|nr:hypothetical protein [Stylosanthes scabra]